MLSSVLEIGAESAANMLSSVPEMAAKLARSVGKAAWLAGTTFLVLGVPLIFVLEREMQIDQMESEQLSQMQTLLGGPPDANYSSSY